MFVCGCSKQPHDAELAKHLKHGTENEVNIISTLVSKIMPAFLPPCYAYFEVGPQIITHGLNGLKIEVSADGILKCTNGLECVRFSEHGDRKIVLEFKSPYATKENPNVTLYDVPQRYVPQLLCECDAWSCTEGWLLVGTPKSVTSFRIYDDKTTLEALLSTAEDLYRSVKPSAPVRLHPSTNCNKEKLKTYIGTHMSFFVQCASVTGEYGNLNPSTEIDSTYAVTPNMNLGPVQHNDSDFQIAVITSESQKLFNSAHTVLRNKATEVVVFMATNKDWVQTNSMPYAFPVAYAMKGSSMSNYDLCYMVSQVKKEFEKRQIPILCEVYDGQWHNYITTDSDSKCLTKLAWRHKWQKVMSFSKQKCIDSMVGGCRLKPGDIELLNISKRMENNQQVIFWNVKVMCHIMPPIEKIVRKILTVMSQGGTGYKLPVLDKFVTVCKHSHPDLFHDEIGYSTCHSYADKEGTQERPPPEPVSIQEEEHNDHTYCSKQNLTEHNRRENVNKPRRRKKKMLGMNASEDNILHLLDSATVAMILEDIEETKTPENVTSTDLLIYVLMDQQCLLLDDILTQLQYIDGVKWGAVGKDNLYPGLFTSRDELMKKCTLKDLKIICKTLEHHTNRCWFETGGVKSAHVNRIIRAFGGTDFVQETALRKRRQTYNPTTLKVAVKNILLNDKYKLEN